MDGRVRHLPMLTVSLVDELVYHPLAQQGVLRVALNCPKYSGGECYPHNSKTEKPWIPSARSENYSSWKPSLSPGTSSVSILNTSLVEPQYTGQVFLPLFLPIYGDTKPQQSVSSSFSFGPLHFDCIHCLPETYQSRSKTRSPSPAWSPGHTCQETLTTGACSSSSQI